MEESNAGKPSQAQQPPPLPRRSLPGYIICMENLCIYDKVLRHFHAPTLRIEGKEVFKPEYLEICSRFYYEPLKTIFDSAMQRSGRLSLAFARLGHHGWFRISMYFSKYLGETSPKDFQEILGKLFVEGSYLHPENKLLICLRIHNMEEEFNRMRTEFDFPIVGCVCGESSGTNYASYREYIEAADRPFAFMVGQSNDGQLGKLIDCHVKVSNNIELPPKMVEIMLSELASKHRIE